MKIIVAETSGFCFGVEKAVEKVYAQLGQGPLYTYGPIIHNRSVVEDLESKGVRIIHDLKELGTSPKGTILIRSHGVSKAEMDAMTGSGFRVVDATCPYVKKIHRVVERCSRLGDGVIIAGDENHPEVAGIKGWSAVPVYYATDEGDLDKLPLEEGKEYCIVAQTTFNYEKYQRILKKLQNFPIRVIMNETVCQATEDRQKEAEKLAGMVDKMIVVGGKNSSNTQKLYEICKSRCAQTYHIETIDDLVLNVFSESDIIGITAGASTPKNIIEEVILHVRNATEF
ncbi:4-hydroxy-3-methylbut-2-enyl diphosphate reductase [Anaerotalea alkaliphila]|uniref:4-hydroxy-3-methylbut-2-enyl diphosphate reductase n=1 Tax=Anaerotalea alkaliphila TaxID=2662126 RepID=A0A7X5KL40_9FIRM|nr:4-hydroxy-3-methylbut-2-enyl diphosphate reductase [Anaerotalea alkaliphila]NDL66304.1 4-hydroxy-3-methylbut-2-enyl diphosphate reductase [Anaerotalea alkaliphila]